MSLEEIISNNSGVFGLLTFFIGLLLGNWFALGRDRRKEFNEISDEVSLLLINKRKGASEKFIHNGPTEDQLEILKRRSIGFKKFFVNKAIESYKDTIYSSKNREQDEVGQSFYKHPEKIIFAIDNLLKYVQRK